MSDPPGPPNRAMGFVVRGDPLALPFADGAFDRVVTSHAHGHLDAGERARFLGEAGRLARELVVVDSALREGVQPRGAPGARPRRLPSPRPQAERTTTDHRPACSTSPPPELRREALAGRSRAEGRAPSRTYRSARSATPASAAATPAH